MNYLNDKDRVEMVVKVKKIKYVVKNIVHKNKIIKTVKVKNFINWNVKIVENVIKIIMKKLN